jgi:transcriptional regulator with XRE-family HTH domain
MSSSTEFSRTLSLLRQQRGVSQRTAAADLGVSQALLSHYENGVREPGLAFVVRACEYYRVSADYILGISDIRKPYAVLEKTDLVRLYNRAAELAKECRRHLSV